MANIFGGVTMIKGLGHAAFNVKDMEKTIAFYEETIGFKKAFDIPRPENGEPWIVYMYGGGGQFIELFYGATKENLYREENIGFFHICVAVLLMVACIILKMVMSLRSLIPKMEWDL